MLTMRVLRCSRSCRTVVSAAATVLCIIVVVSVSMSHDSVCLGFQYQPAVTRKSFVSSRRCQRRDASLTAKTIQSQQQKSSVLFLSSGHDRTNQSSVPKPPSSRRSYQKDDDTEFREEPITEIPESWLMDSISSNTWMISAILPCTTVASLILVGSSWIHDPVWAISTTTTETTTATATAITSSSLSTTTELLASSSPLSSLSTAVAASGSTVLIRAGLAWMHYVGIIGIAGGLASERLLLEYNMPIETENKINTADLVYGISAFSMLLSGVGRAINEKGFGTYYAHEPIFWFKMVSVAVLGGLSLFPAIVFLRRDLARREDPNGNIYLAPLSDTMIDRLTTVVKAEITAVLSIPFMASLMARGVLYWDNFPTPVGVILYVLALGGAGYKYGTEAFDMMESEGALVQITKDEYDELVNK